MLRGTFKLRKEGKYLLGTIDDVVKELYNPNEKVFADRFTECDFALVETEDFNLRDEPLDVIYENSNGFYGIKKIDTGFDNGNYDNIDLFADYYGGGCGTYKLIGNWKKDLEIRNDIKEMIVDVLNYQEGYVCSDDIVVCELKQRKEYYDKRN